MKKIVLISLSLVLLCASIYVMASAEDYVLTFDNERNVFKGVPVNVDVKLIGNEAPVKTNVRVKVDISGPATPTLMATDSSGVEHDIAQLGYWGPDEGFAVGGTFTNTTPVTATFPEAGLYEITLSLIDLTDNNTSRSSVITSTVSNVYVYNDQAELDQILGAQNQINNITTATNNVANNTNATNNTMNTNNALSSIPQTGPSINQYLLYGALLTVIIAISYGIIKKSRIR